MSGTRAGIGDAWQVLKDAMIDVWYEAISLIFLNTLWLLCCVPLVTLPPATAALYVLAGRKARHRSSTWRDFFTAMRDYFWVAWRWALMNLLTGWVFSVSLWVYSQWRAPILTYVVWGIGATWVMVQMYCFPVLLAQEQSSVLLALRNAFVLCMRHPIFTLALALVTALVCLASMILWPAWALFTVALIAFLYQRAVGYLLDAHETAHLATKNEFN